MPRLNHQNWLRVLNANQISSLVLTKYNKDLINYFYNMGSMESNFEVESISFFILVTIGVVMDLQYIIPNRLKI